MRHSFFFRRIITLVFAAVFLSCILTGSVFYYVSNNMLLDEASRNLLPTARNLANGAAFNFAGEIPDQYFESTIEAEHSGRVCVFDANNALVYTSFGVNIPKSVTDKNFRPNDMPHIRIIMNAKSAAYLDRIAELAETVTEGDAEATVTKVMGEYLTVGVPVISLDTSDVIGAVFVSRPIQEVNEIRNSLYYVLIISMSASLFLMMLVAVVASQKISKPVNAMRDVALSMATGDFLIRANEERPGELGQLAASLNFLSSALSSTIEELKIERNRLRNILDGLNEGIIAIDKQGNISHINPAMEHLFGPYDEELSQQPQLYIPDDGLWEDFRIVFEETCSIVRLMHVDNIILRIAITPLEESSGKVVGAVGLFRDITESERLEQTRRDYVANVSHELRTPVSSLRSLAETLKDGMVSKDEDKERYYGYMVRESMRLSRLIDDLLELSRLQSGSIALQKSRVNVQELLLDMQDRFSFAAQDQNIDFAIENRDDCPEAYTNGDRAEQVLVVLLDNAFKYTPDGGTITLGVTWDDEKIQLCVADSGVGIAKEDLPYVFDRFYKADKSHSGNGTGLGLSIAKEVLALMDEYIWVESEDGKGSKFTFTLKRHETLPKPDSEGA